MVGVEVTLLVDPEAASWESWDEMPMGLDLGVSAAKGRCNDSRGGAGKRSTHCCGVECVNMQMGIGREEQGRMAHFWKCRCLAPLSLAEHGERTLSVGETIDLASAL